MLDIAIYDGVNVSDRFRSYLRQHGVAPGTYDANLRVWTPRPARAVRRDYLSLVQSERMTGTHGGRVGKAEGHIGEPYRSTRRAKNERRIRRQVAGHPKGSAHDLEMPVRGSERYKHSTGSKRNNR